MVNSKKSLQQKVKELTQERDVLFDKCKQSEEAYGVLMHQLKEMLLHQFEQSLSDRFGQPSIIAV